MTLREKYGEWGIILGATEGVGKAFAEKIASEGMSVVLVGRREEKLQELGKNISETYGVDHMVTVLILRSLTAQTRFLRRQKILTWDL